MVDFVILNELSLPVGNTVEEASENLKTFIKVVSRLKSKNIDTIRSVEDLGNLAITPIEKLYEYRNKINDRDFKRLINIVFANKVIKFENPLYSKDEIDGNDIMSTEYKFKGKKADGLGACDIFETLSLSFDNKDDYRNGSLLITKDFLDDSGTLQTIEDIEIKNIYNVESLDIYNDYFKKILEFKYKINQKNFNLLKDSAFQKIKFCDEVEGQIGSLNSEVFKSFLQKLIQIELDIKQVNNFESSIESASVRDNEKLKKLRMFSHSDLGEEKVYFDRHIKSFPSGNRMYFLEKDNITYIGYIGKHLPTKKF